MLLGTVVSSTETRPDQLTGDTILLFVDTVAPPEVMLNLTPISTVIALSLRLSGVENPRE